ncbi:hypothetical protein CV717_28775, partial [Bacillus cereus]
GVRNDISKGLAEAKIFIDKVRLGHDVGNFATAAAAGANWTAIRAAMKNPVARAHVKANIGKLISTGQVANATARSIKALGSIFQVFGVTSKGAAVLSPGRSGTIAAPKLPKVDGKRLHTGRSGGARPTSAPGSH